MTEEFEQYRYESMESQTQETSQEIGKLALALSKAQGVMEGAKKDSDNPWFKSKYADLESCWFACRKPLSDNELAVIQTFSENNEKICIITTLAHSSGQWIRGTLSLKPVKNDPQAAGSAITYGRRYSLAAIVGLSQKDDDGNDASGKNKNKKDKEPPKNHDGNQKNTKAWMRIIDTHFEKDKENINSWWPANGEDVKADCGKESATEVYNYWVNLKSKIKK